MRKQWFGTNKGLAASSEFVYTPVSVSPETKPFLCYSLKLADGGLWSFTASADAAGWVRSLAGIMELDETPATLDRGHVVVFTRASDDEDVTAEADGVARLFHVEENAGWYPVMPSPYRGMRLFAGRSGRLFIVHLGPRGSQEEEYVKMQQVLSLLFRETIWGGGFPFHCALFDYEGTAVLLAGSGGAGKSTCCRLAETPFHPLSDDLCLVVRQRRDIFRVHPLPTWSDYLWRRGEGTWPASRSLPLGAIFFLEQSEENGIVPMGQGEASMLINALARQMFEPSWAYGSVQERRTLRRKLFESSGDAARALPAFLLRFRATGGFWREIEGFLR